MSLILNLHIAILSLTAMVALCQAQTTGVYITAEEFRANRPSYPILCQKGGGSVKIKVNSIVVVDRTGKHKFDKKSVFAVRTCRNTFRILGNDDYRIINTEEIYLYSRLISIGGEGAFYEEILFQPGSGFRNNTPYQRRIEECVSRKRKVS